MPACDVLQERLELLLGLAGEQRDAEIDRLLQIGRQLLQHGDAAGDMEPADGDRDAARAELSGDRHGARKLVRLHADEADDAGMARLLDARRDLLDRDADVHLVIGVDVDRHIVAEHLPLGAVLRRCA